MEFNPNGESSVSVDIESPYRPSGLIARLFQAFPDIRDS